LQLRFFHPPNVPGIYFFPSFGFRSLFTASVCCWPKPQSKLFLSFGNRHFVKDLVLCIFAPYNCILEIIAAHLVIEKNWTLMVDKSLY
jgi:hypothetical protein